MLSLRHACLINAALSRGRDRRILVDLEKSRGEGVARERRLQQVGRDFQLM